ncbi:MAG TPA: ATP-binding protein [Egicoccus sp.]|nr:ATP-binding protein [Egicoccus sp.]HSK22585.1 ATP-binding protein [Egicoccus sp.]
MNGWWFAATGGLIAAVVLGGLAVATARHDRARRDAEGREQVLLRLLRTDSLQPQEVLDAVVDGLMAAGFDACVVRLVDEEAGLLRYVAGRGIRGTEVATEVPLGLGLSGKVLGSSGPVVLEDYSAAPDVLSPELGFDGAIGVPIGPQDQPIAVLLAARRAAPLTAGQQTIAVELSEQAGRALEQALRYEATASDVAQLRALDAQTHDFVSTVSHELRTPLTVVQGLGQTLAHRWDDLDPPRREDLTERLQANVARLTSMVATLLETSALQRGQLEVRPETVELEPYLQSLLHRLTTLRATHPVHLDLAAGLRIAADPRLLEHVFENLLGNAARHTPQGTAVRVRAVAGTERVRVEVSDDGPGIAPEDLPFVLERFYRGGDPNRRPSGGLGLGLALAAQIVAAHGGNLEVDSAPGRGTTFAFTLPRDEADGPHRAGGGAGAG